MNLLVISLTIAASTAAYSANIQPEDSKILRGPSKSMSFFVTSTGIGRGGDLGGLEGADKHCQSLAAAVGADTRTWRAYLSTNGSLGKPGVNARDRIGLGPWANYKGDLIARNSGELHETAKTLWEITKNKMIGFENRSPSNNVSYVMALTEKGDTVVSEGPKSQHNILTGSKSDGTAYVVGRDLTCRNWTSSSDEDAVMTGHIDRSGGGPNGSSWNSAEPLQGCSVSKFSENASGGLFYCFAEH